MKKYPDFIYELPYWQKNTYVIGLDEVGRGCLAGPVYVGGVCFPICELRQQNKLKKLKIHDSKQCSALKREKLSPIIKKESLFWHVASSTVEEINTLGIVPSIEKAAVTIVKEITSNLPESSSFIVFTDTLPIKAFNRYKTINQHTIPQADGCTITVAAASIIAKVERDTIMNQLHTNHPHYNWNRNKGYATRTHREAIKEFGVSPLHRTLYLRKLLTT